MPDLWVQVRQEAEPAEPHKAAALHGQPEHEGAGGDVPGDVQVLGPTRRGRQQGEQMFYTIWVELLLDVDLSKYFDDWFKRKPYDTGNGFVA